MENRAVEAKENKIQSKQQTDNSNKSSKANQKDKRVMAEVWDLSDNVESDDFWN